MPDRPVVYCDDDNLWIPPGFLDNSSLSFTARGVLYASLSCKGSDPDFVVDAAHLTQFSASTLHETEQGIEELRANGYLTADNRLTVDVVWGEPPR